MAGGDDMDARARMRAWVAQYGIDRLAMDLDVRERSIYRWITAKEGRALGPSVSKAQAIIRLSNGQLRLEDIYQTGDDSIIKR